VLLERPIEVGVGIFLSGVLEHNEEELVAGVPVLFHRGTEHYLFLLLDVEKRLFAGWRADEASNSVANTPHRGLLDRVAAWVVVAVPDIDTTGTIQGTTVSF